jgi:hypothetical protein
LISKSGEIVLPPIYDDIANFNDYSRKLCLIKYHGKFGFINRRGKIVTDPIYDSIEDFGEFKRNWAQVKIDTKFGFVNRKGALVMFKTMKLS